MMLLVVSPRVIMVLDNVYNFMVSLYWSLTRNKDKLYINQTKALSGSDHPPPTNSNRDTVSPSIYIS